MNLRIFLDSGVSWFLHFVNYVYCVSIKGCFMSWKVKPIEEIVAQAERGEKLKRSLGRLNLISLGVGCTIGAGVFVLTGHVAAQFSGPAVVLSLVLSALVCVFAGLCYAELASTIPVSGSAYTYTYATLGEGFAWLIGWTLILEYLLGASTVAVGWSGYVASFLKDFGLYLPQQLIAGPMDKVPGLVNLPAMLVTGSLSLLLLFGIQSSARFNNIIVAVKVAVILLFVICGLAYVNHQNWVPFIPSNQGEFGEFGISGVLRGAAAIFFAYVGFDAVSTAALEARKPQRDIPVGILGALVVVTILYAGVALVMTGMIPYTQLNVAAPVAVAVDAAGPALSWLRPLIKIGAIAGLTSVILVLLLGQTRVLFAVSKDGLLPPILSHVSKKYSTPYVTTLLCGAVAMVMAGFVPLDILSDMVSMGTLLAFAVVCLGVLILRKRRPDLHRPFKAPFSPVVPIIGIIVTLGQMTFLPLDNWKRLGVWLVLGFMVYWFYGRKNSLVGQAIKAEKESASE